MPFNLRTLLNNLRTNQQSFMSNFHKNIKQFCKVNAAKNN